MYYSLLDEAINSSNFFIVFGSKEFQLMSRLVNLFDFSIICYKSSDDYSFKQTFTSASDLKLLNLSPLNNFSVWFQPILQKYTEKWSK